MDLISEDRKNLKYFLIFIPVFFISFYFSWTTRDIINAQVRSSFFLLLGFSAAYLLTPAAAYISTKAGVLDIPDKRKIHSTPTPLFGGIAIYIAFALTTVSTLWYSWEFKGVVYGVTIIFILGLLDDIFSLSSIFRLLIQVFAVFVLFIHGVEFDFIPDNTRYHLIEKTFTLFWVIGITNAVNFLDGMDGLCAGFGAISALFFGTIALITRQYHLMFLAFALSGSCFGFLPWNFRYKGAATIFLGSSGSLLIGFTLASMAILGDWATNRTAALFVPILILFLPIFDTAMTTFFRVSGGSVRNLRQWLDFVGKDHFHHRLSAVGFSNKETVFAIYCVTTTLGVSALIIRTGGLLEAYMSLIQAAVILIFLTIVMIKTDRKEQTRNMES